MTVARFRPLMPIEHIVVVTNVAYRKQILEQIPDMKPEQVLCEPARRNTAPAIAYAVAHIKGVLRQEAIAAGALDKDDPMDLSHAYCDANIIVAPSVHFILNEEEFQRVLRCGLDFIGAHDSLLSFGMKPTRPETGYGYVQIEDRATHCRTADAERPLMLTDRAARCQTESEIYAVKTFTEKPNLELAKVFVESGEFLWNSGILL